MQKVIIIFVFAGIIAFGMLSSANATLLYADIAPNHDILKFKVKYDQKVFIEYPDGGDVADALSGTSWNIKLNAAPDSNDSKIIADMLNENTIHGGSPALISDLDVDYSVYYRGYDLYAVINYEILITGSMEEYVIRPAIGNFPALIDVRWRDLHIEGPVNIGDTEINHLLSAIETQNPEFASMIKGSDAEVLLTTRLLDSGSNSIHSLSVWHFVFTPAGLDIFPMPLILDREIFDYPISMHSVGQCGYYSNYTELDATFTADKTYDLRIVQPENCAYLQIAGFTQVDDLNGIEVLSVLPTKPSVYDPPVSNVTLVYVIFGLGIACVVFFMYYMRRKKRQNKIDPPFKVPGSLENVRNRMGIL